METVYIDKHAVLINSCKEGQRSAQYEIYKLYSKAMYNISMRILNHEEEAEDVLQESFLDAFSRIKDFRQESTFGLWLKQIVVNKSINYLRKRKVEFISTEDIDVVDDSTTINDDDTEYKVEQIRKAILELPDGYRVVLSLYLLEGYDHEEISHILKISENTSRTQLLRAKIKLKNILHKKGIVR